VNPISPATPLVALEAAAIDTETTGLNPAVARIIQLGAVKLNGGKRLDGTLAEYLVAPGVPIPPASSAIHGLTDQAVAGAPPFRDVWPEFAEHLRGRVLIGYRTGFDIAVLKRECTLAGIAWADPPRLCIRSLALCVAPPSLDDYTLDGLCRWLDIRIEKRHSASGDALAAADIWARLLPMLLQRGIRTLGEAAAATPMKAGENAMTPVFGKTMEPDMAAPGDSTPARRLDSYAYRHRVRDVMSAPAIFVPGETTLRKAVRIMMEKRLSSLLVQEPGSASGIVTERDLLRGMAAKDGAGETSIAALATRPLLTIPADMHLYKAVGRMNRLGIRHLAVADADGTIVGMVTPRNLLRERATEAIMLGDEIDAAADASALAAARAKLIPLAASLLADDMDARGVCAVISAELCALTRRAAELAEARMAAEGKGAPPVPYAVLVLGSGGRGESLLAPDQDNAIVYERGEAGGPEDRWFAELGAHIADMLDLAGIPYCKGGVMARNPEWRKSVAGWRMTVDGWIRRSRPEDLLRVDIFFDSLPVHGDLSLGEEIWNYAYGQGQSSVPFQKLLTELARDWRSPLGFFGGFRADKGERTDLKIGGLMPIFTGGRVLSIKHGVRARSTPRRLLGVAAEGGLGAGPAETILAAHETILCAILRQQLADAGSGVPVSNLVDTGRLGSEAKAKLRQAVKNVALLIDTVSEARL
jgi:CBS domain-containing protein